MTMPTFADRLFVSRKALGLTMQQVADKAGCTKAAISQYESGKVPNAKMAQLFALSDVLQVSARWLALGTGSPTKSINLTPDEQQLILNLRELAKEQRNSIFSLLDSMRGVDPKKAPNPAHRKHKVPE